MIKILDSSFKLQAILRDVIDCSRYEELNGENVLAFKCVLDEKAQLIDENSIIELDDDYFDVAYYEKKRNEDGTVTLDVEAEHVSYRLNNAVYNKDYFTETGTPTEILTAILQGTGFTVGDVEFTDAETYSAQEKKSRRQILMEFFTLLGGEGIFDKFEISIVQHRGETSPQIYTTGKNIKIVSKIYNKRERGVDGNPLVSYVCNPIYIPGRAANLGDEVLLVQNDLGVKEKLRTVSFEYNPYEPLTYEIQIANFVPGFEDQIYRIETNTVAKEKVYNGCRISADDGFEAIRSDNKAKTVMNATEGISIYSDVGSGLVKNFYVDTNGKIMANNIEIGGNGTFGGILSANQIKGGTLSGITLDIDTDAVVGDKLTLGSSSSNIEMSYTSTGFYLSRNGNKLLKFYSDGFWVDGGLDLPSGDSIGVFTSGIEGTSWTQVLQLSNSELKMAPGGVAIKLNMNNQDILNIGDEITSYGNATFRAGSSGGSDLSINCNDLILTGASRVISASDLTLSLISSYSSTKYDLKLTCDDLDVTGVNRIYAGSTLNIYGAYPMNIESGYTRDITITSGGKLKFVAGGYGYGISLDSTYIGLFGATPASKTTISDLSTSATLTQAITKLNDLIGALRSYGAV